MISDNNYIHVGHLIQNTVKQQGMTVVQFAKEIHYDRSNVYKIFNKQSIDSDLLKHISAVLKTDFFILISEEIKDKIK